MKIMCIAPIGIGNYLLTYPAMHLLRQHRPDAELHLLALRGGMASIAENDPLWNNVHCIDPTGEKSMLRISSFVMKLRRVRFDASLGFFPSNTWQYSAFPLLCGIPRRYGFTYDKKKIKSLQFLYTDRIPVDPLLHDIDQCLRLSAHFLGIGVPASEPVFPQLFTQKETAEASLFVQEHSRSKMHIAVHAGSSAEHGMDLKRWAPERFAALADRICGYLGADAFVLGGNEEAEIKKRVASAMKAPAVIVDRKDLRSTAAIINACSLMLCNDAGLMHIAACSGVPVAAVFGPTDEKRTAPAGKGHCIIRKPMEGFPVWTAKNAGDRSIPKEIDPRASLEALTVEDAWRIVEPWLVERWRAC